MKKSILMIAILVQAFICHLSFAQQKNKMGRSPEMMAEKRTNKLETELGLKPEQKVLVQKALTSLIQQVQEAKKSQSTDSVGSKMQVKKVKKEYKDQMKSILTADQFSKWMSNMKEKAQARKNNKSKVKEEPSEEDAVEKF